MIDIRNTIIIKNFINLLFSSLNQQLSFYNLVMAFTNNLASQWLNPINKEFLKQRLRASAKGKPIQTTDTAIAEEYYRWWLEVPTTNPLQRLVRHPLLTIEDKQKIDKYVQEQQTSQLKTASISTGVGITIYWLFLSRSSFFQNIFNNKQRRPIFNTLRKGFGVYLLFLSSMIALNSTYEKKIPNGLDQMGMFKQYRIFFQQKYV